MHTFLPVCRRPNLRKLAVEEMDQASKVYGLVCKSVAQSEIVQLGLEPAQVIRLNQCFSMLVSQPLVEFYSQQGAYLLTPGWLDNWQAHLKSWGFDQPTAQAFFQEFARKLTLLDSQINPLSAALLHEMGQYLNLPVEIIPVGIEHLQLYLARIISDWQSKIQLAANHAMLAEANRKTADYAMAFDLLTNLTNIRNETEAIDTILDLFSMLFSPGSVSYYPVVSSLVDTSRNCQSNKEGQNLMQRWAIEKDEDYLWTNSETGFFLRIHFQSETLGVLWVDEIKLLQYKHQYLNLALSVANLCGLTLANARTFQLLKEAESRARREKEISETLREILSELTLQLDLDELLERILISLSRVTPFSDAAISLFEENQLNFVVGHRFSPQDTPVAFPLPDLPLSLVTLHSQDQDSLINSLTHNAMIQNYLGGEDLLSWMNVPLVLHGTLVGFLSMGHRDAHIYQATEVKLVKSFADEVSIAVENARLFKKIQTLAITDDLTGLYNRRHFYHLADLEFVRSTRYNRPLSLLMADIDLFKHINDTYGHLNGDKVLRAVAQHCSSKVRRGDVVGRYGGEELVLLLPETPSANAHILAERLREAVAVMPTETEQGSIRVTISIGVASLEPGCHNLEELLRRSDEALYVAKRAGRNCVSVWQTQRPPAATPPLFKAHPASTDPERQTLSATSTSLTHASEP